MNTLPILYSFRRCPYAIRARLAIAYAQVEVELREVLLKDKPQALLAASPKGTVPVLVLADGQVLDESRDIMAWALAQNDRDAWMPKRDSAELIALIDDNDGPFKHWLDQYKYADRFPEQSATWYRQQAEPFLETLNDKLVHSEWLLEHRFGLADAAIFPFVRQFAMVDQPWFAQCQLPQLRRWLDALMGSALFESVMHKHPPWHVLQPQLRFPDLSAG